MGLVTRSGSRDIKKSTPVVPAKENNHVLVPDNILDAKDRDVDKLARIEDTFTTRHSVNPVSYPEEFRKLMAYPRGTAVHVTYFFQNLPDIDHQSAMSDISVIEHHLHKDLTEVRKMEMRFLDQIQNEFREDDNSWSLSVEALVYPGREPHMGDIFLIEVGNNKIIQFQVNNITPTTYRQGSYFRITANSYQFATAQSLETLRNCVTDVYYFDKDKYFDDGRVTLLKHQSYIDLRKLEHLRKSLIETYMNKFYREDFESVAYFDDTYDPYLVEYLKNKISLSDYHRRPEQLDTTLHDYEKSIWYKLANSVCPDYLDDTIFNTTIEFNIANALSPTNNRLDNSNKVALDKENSITGSTIANNNYSYGKPIDNKVYTDTNGNFTGTSLANSYVDHSTSTKEHRSTCVAYNRANGIFRRWEESDFISLLEETTGKPISEYINRDTLIDLLKNYGSRLRSIYSYGYHTHCNNCNCYNSNNGTSNNTSTVTNNSNNLLPFSLAFFTGNRIDMSQEEELIYDFLHRNEINVEQALKTISNYRRLEDSKKYYVIPALIAVIDYLIIELR